METRKSTSFYLILISSLSWYSFGMMDFLFDYNFKFFSVMTFLCFMIMDILVIIKLNFKEKNKEFKSFMLWFNNKNESLEVRVLATCLLASSLTFGIGFTLKSIQQLETSFFVFSGVIFFVLVLGDMIIKKFPKIEKYFI